MAPYENSMVFPPERPLLKETLKLRGFPSEIRAVPLRLWGVKTRLDLAERLI